MRPAAAFRSVIVERDIPHPAEKIWRALTQAPLIEEWLMSNDFEPLEGHCFTLRAPSQPQWNGVTNCRVLEIEPCARLVYTWEASGDEAADGIKTVVTFVLTPLDDGTRLRVEHSGFRPQDENNLRGATMGWDRFLKALERVVREKA